MEGKFMKFRIRLAALILIACFLLSGASAEMVDPVCFEGAADYTYADSRLSVQIKRVQENGVTYFVADIQAADASVFSTALSRDKVNGTEEPTSVIASRNGAVLAINGDDYGTHKYGTIIRNSTLIRTHNTTRHMLIIDRNGDFTVHTGRTGEDNQALADRLMAEGVTNTLEFGPELVRDGVAVSLKTEFDLIATRDTQLEPRTALGQISPLHYIVIVVDGRAPGYSDGISLQGLQQLFIRYGAVTAFNLDGGGSTTLYFNGGVINQPSGGKERTVTDIVMFK
jgi:exopolysaccharide biosynthesis protein